MNRVEVPQEHRASLQERVVYANHAAMRDFFNSQTFSGVYHIGWDLRVPVTLGDGRMVVYSFSEERSAVEFKLRFG